MKRANPADDPRYVQSDDPRAMLRAWGGEDRHSCTMDMGGWTDLDIEAFWRAVQAESKRAAGAPLKYISIESGGRMTKPKRSRKEK